MNAKKLGDGPIVYWMSRDQRVADNWALLYAQELAVAHHRPLAVVFALVPSFLGATMRQYDFLLRGLEEVEAELRQLHIPFFLEFGDPSEVIPNVVRKWKAGAVVTDVDPLRVKTKWRAQVARAIDVACIEVDAHNVVPHWVASEKLEFAAYTLRPKIHRLLPEFLTAFPKLAPSHRRWPSTHAPVDWKRARATIDVDTDVAPVDWLLPGEDEARRALTAFLTRRLPGYGTHRNDPNVDGQSGLSPYLHFGQISAQRVALQVRASHAPEADKEAFLEELIVRRELADNFCAHQPHYDRVEGFPAWAQATLNDHRKDKRPQVYTRAQFARGETHDPLWNAAQLEMVNTGKMHGYMRMYWAKKILEWTPSPEDALRIAIDLNDRFELDGRDPNGYAGIAWSIGGVHDRAWFNRPIFGKIRYMSANGAKGKFDVAAYIAKWTGAQSTMSL